MNNDQVALSASLAVVAALGLSVSAWASNYNCPIGFSAQQNNPGGGACIINPKQVIPPICTGVPGAWTCTAVTYACNFGWQSSPPTPGFCSTSKLDFDNSQCATVPNNQIPQLSWDTPGCSYTKGTMVGDVHVQGVCTSTATGSNYSTVDGTNAGQPPCGG